MTTRAFAFIAAAALAFSITTPARADVLKDMGPQVFSEPSVESVGGDDAQITSAVEAAVAVAKQNQFHYDASGSREGRVVVVANWKGRPITLTMRFFKKEGALYIASGLSQPGDLSLKHRGEKIEGLYYTQLLAETKQRGLQLFADANARP